MRLLVIEDYAPLREALARGGGLRDAGYAVDATGSGVDRLWYAENHLYDAIILDLMRIAAPYQLGDRSPSTAFMPVSRDGALRIQLAPLEGVALLAT